jgi:hypothetical protein
MILFLKERTEDELPTVTGTFGNFKEVFVDIYYKYIFITQYVYLQDETGTRRRTPPTG